jgi:cytochrome P450
MAYHQLNGGGDVSHGTLPCDSLMPSAIQTSLLWFYPFSYLAERSPATGRPFTIRATNTPPLVFFRDPQETGAVLAGPGSALHPGEGGAMISPIVGENSFMLSDDKLHRTGRKAALAALGARAIEGHAAMIAEVARRKLTHWPSDVGSPTHGRLRALTLEVILRTLTGNLEDELDPQVAVLHRQVLDMLTITASPTFVEPRLRHGPGKLIWNRFLRCRERVDELLTQLISDGRFTSSLGRSLGGRQGDNEVDGVQLARDNVMSLILAGHETTAAQLAWAFQLLAHHPSVCDRLIREIDADRKDEYLTATVQEVLRHRCVFVFAIPRVVATPVEIGAWTYAPPAHLLACIYLLHHDPAIYRDPHAFRPERFLDTPPDPLTWVPWGGGRKRCPGLHLAMLEMKVVLRTVLRERTPRASTRRMERPRWRSVIVAPHAGSQVVLASRR